jgi:orotidine-5'-phosphate decarboxylase
MDQLLVALDVDTAGEARRLAGLLRGVVGGFKIGSQLFTNHGPSIVDELADRGDRVFLDLKFHDIPNTVAAAVRAATRSGAWMINVHASGGAAMMRAAREAADEESARQSRRRPLVIAVTMLTSLDDAATREVGFETSTRDQVGRLAKLASAAGLDGVVASPQEISLIRRCCGESFVIVTPGIRAEATLTPASSASAVLTAAKDDQKRTLSASEAIEAGADYLVVGRPIISAPDPRAAAERLARQCKVARTHD